MRFLLVPRTYDVEYVGFEDDEKVEKGKPAGELASPSEFESEGAEQVPAHPITA
jgi:hypothetical protein